MLTENIEQKIWLKEFDVEDLSRAIIREFCVQNKLTQTLNSFETEDIRNKKKITKSILIRMLQMNNIVYWNKQSDKPFRSLLEILVNYLKNKFKDRIQGRTELAPSESDNNKTRTDFSAFEEAQATVEKNSDRLKEQKEKSITTQFKNDRGKTTNSSRVKVGKIEQRKQKNKPTVHQIYSELAKHEEKEKLRKEQTKVNEIIQEHRQKNQELEYELERQKEKIILLEEEKMSGEGKIANYQVENEKLRKSKNETQDKLRNEIKKSEQLEQIIEKNKISFENQKKLRQRELKKIEKEFQEKISQEKENIIREHEQKLNKIMKDHEKQVLHLKQKMNKKEEQQVDLDLKNQEVNSVKQKKQKISEISIQNSKKQDENSKYETVKVSNKTKVEEVYQVAAKNQQEELPVRKGGMRKIMRKNSQDKKFNKSRKVTDQFQEKKQIQQKEMIKKEQYSQKQQNSEVIPVKNEPEGPKMVKMFGKKKKQMEEEGEQKKETTTKFKFDENFVDKPLNADDQKYEYERIQFNKMLLEESKKGEIEYSEKKYVQASKKFPEKSMTAQQGEALKKIVFQGGLSNLPKAWSQGFILSPFNETPYGLQQIEGGPCGIIAAVQCYFLKHLIHLSACSSQEELKNDILRENCLVAALADILFKCKSSEKITLCLPPKSFSGTKVDIMNLRFVTIDASSFEQAFNGLFAHKNFFIGKTNHGVTVLMYSIIATKGIENIQSEIDMKESPLIGNHGHCTQELVNLFITGKAVSNCFDNDKILDDDMRLHGVKEKSQFGFLTIFETLKYIEVGKNLKNPTYPIWIICKEFHYHVIFSNHYLISELKNAEKFDIVYFDGLYNCGDKIVITLEKYAFGEEPTTKEKDLPLIEQVMMTKWGPRKADWNGSIKIL